MPAKFCTWSPTNVQFLDDNAGVRVVVYVMFDMDEAAGVSVGEDAVGEEATGDGDRSDMYLAVYDFTYNIQTIIQTFNSRLFQFIIW